MRMYYGMFMEEYTRLNSEKEEKADDPKNHLKFTKVDDFLYTLTGSVGEGDCDKIVDPNARQLHSNLRKSQVAI